MVRTRTNVQGGQMRMALGHISRTAHATAWRKKLYTESGHEKCLEIIYRFICPPLHGAITNLKMYFLENILCSIFLRGWGEWNHVL